MGAGAPWDLDCCDDRAGYFGPVQREPRRWASRAAPGRESRGPRGVTVRLSGYRRVPMGFRDAQETLWGEAGAWAHDTWHDLNASLFAGELTYAGIVWALLPHGGSLGHCESSGRITLHPSLVAPAGARPWGGPAAQYTDRFAGDVLVHEMIHALLFDRGVPLDDRAGHHNTLEWCAEIMRLSPPVIGRSIKAEPVKPRRIDGKVQRKPRAGYLTRDQAAHWPHSMRPDADAYYPSGNRLSFRPLDTEHP